MLTTQQPLALIGKTVRATGSLRGLVSKIAEGAGRQGEENTILSLRQAGKGEPSANAGNALAHIAGQIFAVHRGVSAVR